jgi:hypothetical protein
MSSWSLLDEKEETELHKSRLLNVEEKPFKRITKRLVSLNSLAASKSHQAPTPPPETTANGANSQDVTLSPPTRHDAVADLEQVKEDIILDFAAFDSSIARLQFLLSANERERTRYEADRVRILEMSQAVRDNTAQLRLQLDQAKATLEQRKMFDELAEKITSNRLLRPRADQQANLRKLEQECAQLEAESETYADTWRERRDQFARIMDESMRLRRLIRDEKEEVERREGMDDGGAGADGDAEAAGTPRAGLASGNATPRPDSGLVVARPGLESGDVAGTPRASTAGGMTPARESPGAGGEIHGPLKPRLDPMGSLSQLESQDPSRDATPSRGENGQPNGTEEGEDVEMDDVEQAARSPLTPILGGNPRIVVDGQGIGENMDTT